MALLSAIVTAIQTRSGDTNITEASVTGWVNECSQVVGAQADWPWTLEATDTDTTTAATQEIALQTRFKKMMSLRLGSAGGTEPDAAEQSFLGFMERNVAVSNSVEGYYINPTNSKYGLVPTPATSGQKVYQRYYARPDTVSAVSATPAIPAQYDDIYTNYGLARYWEENDELDKTVLYETKVANTVELMRGEFIKSVGDLGKMKDLRETMAIDNPQKPNTVTLGQ